jgi:electron transfer flavoprotein beta subunit
VIAACLKWVDRRPSVDPLSGVVRTDTRTSGPSDSDETALEWALRLGDAWAVDVIALSAGPEASEPMLRDAVAAGATLAVRVDSAEGATSEHVSAALAGALPASVDLVICGAWSVDRGSGSVPAYLAARLGAAQALGLVGLSIEGATPEGATLAAERRLDGGRRERLRVSLPAVLSLEGGGVRLRRASLGAVLAARTKAVEVINAPAGAGGAAPGLATPPVRTTPFRPRPRVLPAPGGATARERILALTGALVDRDPPRVVRLDPAAAADELLAQLQAWGYGGTDD